MKYRPGEITLGKTLGALLAVLILLPVLSASEGSFGARLAADRIHTWTEGRQRVFLLDGNARVDTPSGTLSSAAFIIYFDEAAAAESEALTLRVYDEKAGRVTVVETQGPLSVDDRWLVAAGPPKDPARAMRARMAVFGAPRRRRSEQEVPPLPSAVANEEPESATPFAASLVPAELAESEEVELEIAPTDSDGYDLKSMEIEDVSVWVITGGIEISFGDWSMRAGNMVVYVPGDAEEKTDDFQIYAEDNVRFFTPQGTLEADRLFFDYKTARATLVSAAVYAQMSAGGEPLVLRAGKIRLLSSGTFEARNATVTTCTFGRPHYRFQASDVTMTPRRDAAGSESAMVVSRNNRLYVGSIPVLYLARLSRDFRATHTPLRRVRAGNSSESGNYVYTEFDVLDIMSGTSSDSWAARVSEWADVAALLDYRSEKGTGGGLDVAYETDDVMGALLGYYIKDRGTDAEGFAPTSDDRGRLRWRQRAFVGSTQVDTEASYISDRGFLRQYYEREDKEAKTQETYIYVKQPWEHAAASILYRARLNDYQSQVEYLPQGRLDVVGLPLSDGKVLYTSTTRADNVRMRPDFSLPAASYRTGRVDSIHMLEFPFAAPCGFTVTPFATARGSWFDDTVSGDSESRYAPSWGAHVAAPAIWRVWDVHNDALDVSGLRHVVNFDFTYEDIYDSTRRPAELLQFDDVEAVRRTQAATLRLRQRLQTKRPAAKDEEATRTVDLVSVDLETDYFPTPGRDNAGDNFSDLRFFSRAYLTDDVSIIANGDYDTYEGRIDKAGAWIRVDHSPRTTLAIGNRYVRMIRSSVISLTANHVVTDRWGLGFLAQYDYDKGNLLDEQVILKRSVHDFGVDIYIRHDKGRDETSAGVSVYPLLTRRPASRLP